MTKELDELRVYRSYYNERFGQGFAIAMDYPYRPRVRQWDDLAPGNPIRPVICARDSAYRQTLKEFITYQDRLPQFPGKSHQTQNSHTGITDGSRRSTESAFTAY